ncbi:MAG TPA: DNA-3-methyladenine glycosylase 2 family protein [Candidatus Angelobacter sp.]|jgi:3-methyladenine DNA glycosylase/8-oxoguanine DNA glycosylase|nr:DNA-3-methyladenine glycosylase 2 family protein [Candidatus Angelobacter sp.]
MLAADMLAADVAVTLVPEHTVDPVATLSLLGRGGLDPCVRRDGATLWWATRTPHGAATLRIGRAGREVQAAAWGDGAPWLLERLPVLIGADRPPLETLGHSGLEAAARRLPGLRLPSTGALVEALLPAIVEQRVAGLEARRSWAGLVRLLGDPAPGPAGLLLPPDPARVAALADWDLHRLNLERQRGDTLRRVARRAAAIERLGASVLPPEEVRRRLVAELPGVGVWTVAEAAFRALGDEDAVAVGDYNLYKHVGWALTGRPARDDAEMLRLLEPWSGRRGLAVQLLVAAVRMPRRAPRIAVRDFRRH